MKRVLIIFLLNMIAYSQQDNLPKTLKIHEVINAFNDSLDVVDAVVLTKIPYSDTTTIKGYIRDSLDRIESSLDGKIKYTDTTSLVAMQWELNGKQVNITNIADTSKYIEYSDTTNSIAKQWELNGKQNIIPNLSDTSKYVEKGGDTLTGVIRFNSGAGFEMPHLMQSDSSDQAIADVNNAQVVTFNTDVHHDLITRTSSSRFTVTKAGSYLIVISAIAASTLPGKRFEIWLRTNGNDVANSNTIYDFKAANSITVISVSFIDHFAANDYFEFWMWGNDTGVRLEATTIAGSPVRPATPSIIMTANYVGTD